MASGLSPDRDAVIDQLVAGGIFSDRHQALNHAVDLLRDEAETLAAIREGLESIERGEGIPFDEAIRVRGTTFQKTHEVPPYFPTARTQ